jgi:hypothetical protein
MKIKFIVPILYFFFAALITDAQSNPQILDSALTINRLMTVRNDVIRMGIDPISHNIFYIQTSGNIYEVIQPQSGAAYDSLVDSTAHHTVDYVQGFVFHDSTLYVSGNNHSDSSKTAGIIVRGKLQQDGSRIWDTLMITQYYQTADYFDHLFSGVTVNAAGDTIYICSGARGDHGEVQTRYGTYPGLRNVPLTTNIYALPTHNAGVITLMNDSALLAASGYVYCRGVRNHFDMAFDSNGNLFGLENSGDRDHNEEMNWLRKDHDYGFPWKMGDTFNPQQYAWFNPATDKLINHFSRSWRLGFFSNDPAYPQPPPGLVFDSPIQNYGPDCDKYRDSLGAVLDASDSSISIGTFTAHRSPLGLVFDNAHVLSPQFNGDAFMLSWTKGYDSCGCSTPPDTTIGPFVDPGQDLVHLDLSFDSAAGNFRLNATRIIADFEHPVDADIDSNKIYVIENGYGGTSGLYEVTLPVPLPCNPVLNYSTFDPCIPDSNYVVVYPSGTLPNDYYLYDTTNTLLHADTNSVTGDSLVNIPSGNYYMIVHDNGSCPVDTLLINVFYPLNLHIDSALNTTCIGCNDGMLYYSSASGGTGTYNYAIDGAPVFASPVGSLSPGNHTFCVTDFVTNCIVCDTINILDDPLGIEPLSGLPEYTIYPNPAFKYIFFDLKGEKKVMIRFMDSNGKQIKILTETDLKPGSNLIDCSDLAAGIYSVEIISGSRYVYKKLVILNQDKN